MADATRELVARGLHALRRSSFWWTLGILALALVSVAAWPSLEGTAGLEDLADASEGVLEAFGAQNIATPSGYLDGQLYALMLPLLLSGMAVAAVTALTSGDEDAGRLELVHALPVSRRSVWLARLAATVLALAGVAVLTAACVAVTLGPFSLDEVSVGSVVAATFACAALGAFHAAVAYAVGGLGGSRAVSVGVALHVLVAGYVIDFLLPLSDTLDALQPLSPWYWAIGEQPVSDGIDGGLFLVLLAVTVVLVAVGTRAIEGRDIRSA
jgi:ABC-2 type transport system permease protein